MKKLFYLVMTILLGVTLAACSSKSSKEEKTYDGEFIQALAKGLESRWKFADSSAWSDSATSFKKALQEELDKVEEYKDKKFSDSKLQELALSYINSLKSGQEVAKTYGSDNFTQNWMNHRDERNSILNEINSIKEIPVANKESLNELLADGKEATANNDKKEAIENLVKNISFSVDSAKSNEFTTYYSATVENTTSYTIKNLSIAVNLVNTEGVTVDTTYVDANNWKPGTKTLMEFPVFDKEFEKTELTVSYYQAE